MAQWTQDRCRHVPARQYGINLWKVTDADGELAIYLTGLTREPYSVVLSYGKRMVTATSALLYRPASGMTSRCEQLCAENSCRIMAVDRH